MTSIDKQQPVMITGATGYIAGWIIKELLDAGRTVHATVRDPKNHSALSHLHRIAAKSSGQLKFFKADLLDPYGFDAALRDCALVLHTASPFHYKPARDPERELVRPAVAGTRHVLAAVERATSVRRVVLTSSVLAIYGDAVDGLAAPNQTLDEACWNRSSSPSHQAYAYSKVMAEREAWSLCRAQASARWDLVVLNPALVMGPSLTPHTSSGSVAVLSQFGTGIMRAGVPPIMTSLVDVRDVARAHLLAADTPAAAGRYLLSAATLSLLQIADLMRPHFPDYPLPRNEVPKWLSWLIAPWVGLRREFVAKNAGYPLALDHSKSKTLGVSYRPLEQTLVEHFEQLIDDGLLPRRGSRPRTRDGLANQP